MAEFSQGLSHPSLNKQEGSCRVRSGPDLAHLLAAQPTRVRHIYAYNGSALQPPGLHCKAVALHRLGMGKGEQLSEGCY